MGNSDDGRVDGRRLDPEVPPRRRELGRLVTVAEQAVVTDATKAARQDMKDKAAEQIGRLEGEGFLPAAVSVVAPAHADDAVAQPEQSIVGEGDAMGVASEIVKDVAGSGEGLLRVNDPGWLPQTRKRDQRSSVGIVTKCLMERSEILSAKDLRKCMDREEKCAGPPDPSSMRGVQTTHRDDAMQVDVQGQILPPGVQHGDDAGLRSEVRRVAGEFVQGVGGSLEE